MTLRTEIDHLLPALEQAYESLGEAVNIVDSEDRLVFVNSTWLSLYGRSKEEISDKPLASIFLGDQVVVNDEMVRDAPGEKWVGEVERTRKNGEPFTAHLTVTFLKGRKGERLGRIAVVRDLTKAKRSEDAIRSLAKEQTVLAELGQIISSSLNTGDVFDHFADRVSSLIKYDRISIVIADDDEGIAYTTYCSGISIPEWEPGIVHPLKGTAAEAILRSGIPILANGDSIRSLVKDFPPLLPALEKSGLQSRLSVPLISNGRPVGVLTLNSLEFDAFSDHELTLMSKVGAQIAG